MVKKSAAANSGTMHEKIHDLSEKEPEVFYDDDELTLAQIDEDEREDIPIFGVVLSSGAYSVFYPYDDGEQIRVLHIHNEEENAGEMSTMMDFITQRFGINQIEFFNVTNTDLINKLDRPSTKTIQIDDPRHDDPQKVLIAEVEWRT